MARRRISVEKIKEVIRYGVTTELSERAIGRALKVSRTAVTKCLECFRGSGLTWEQAQELPDSELLAVLERAVTTYCLGSSSSSVARSTRIMPAVPALPITISGSGRCLARSTTLPTGPSHAERLMI